MKKENLGFEILTPIDRKSILGKIELAGRTAYKSEDKITNKSSSKFVEMLVKKRHFSVIEHVVISIKFILDRGLSHELVRHRIASFTQESTRYCNYANDKFNNELTFIDMRNFLSEENYSLWEKTMLYLEEIYLEMISNKISPQIARSVLPNSLKTEIIVTANLREWREILKQRTAKDAHPQMRALMIPLLKILKIYLPEIFNDI